MTYEEKKAWLRRYQQAKRLEQLRLDELDTLKTDASNMTQCLSAVPGGGGDGRFFQGHVCFCPGFEGGGRGLSVGAKEPAVAAAAPPSKANQRKQKISNRQDKQYIYKGYETKF